MHENNRNITFRCSEYQEIALAAAIRKSGMSRSAFMRSLVDQAIGPVLNEAMAIAVARHTAKADVGELVVQALREMADTARPDRLVSRG